MLTAQKESILGISNIDNLLLLLMLNRSRLVSLNFLCDPNHKLS